MTSGGGRGYRMADVLSVDEPLDPRELFEDDPLPSWVKGFRPAQWRAIVETVKAFEEGNRVVWLDGPPGSGKTLIAVTVQKLLGARAHYMCSTKSLQNQFARDFPDGQVLKGRANYATALMPYPEYTAADCEGNDCGFCPSKGQCGYLVAKNAAVTGDLAVLNTSYFLADCNFVDKSQIAGRDLVIADECDGLERELMGFVEFNIGRSMLDMLKIEVPKKGSHKTTIARWIRDEFMVKAETRLKAWQPVDLRGMRARRRLETVYRAGNWIAGEIEQEGWVRDNEEWGKSLVLKPVKVDRYGEKYLWRHGKKWLCMSGTIISADELSESLGLDGDWAVVHAPMTFAVENRRVNVAPVADMAAREKETSWPKVARAIEKILDKHNGERVLVHTVSYELTKYLQEALDDGVGGREIIGYAKAVDRESALELFRATDNAVLLAPSMDRGIDLEGDDCRVVVIAKVPFPYLGDRQVSERLRAEGGQLWYNVQTVRTLVQMTGRGVRNEKDWCVSYVLDKQFVVNVMRKNRGLLPKWWQDGLNTSFPTRELL